MYRFVSAATLLIGLLGGALCGCGTGGSGGGSSTLTPAPPGLDPIGVSPDPSSASREGLGTAVFEVDLDSGDVQVTPLEPATDGSRALFTGRTIEFHSSKVLDQPGNAGVRVLRVAMTNRWDLPIGRLPDGTVTGLRVLFSEFANNPPGTALAAATQVRTLQQLGDVSPVGIAAAADGTVYVGDYHTGRILRLRNGGLELVAGGAAGSADGVGAAAGLRTPHGIAIDPPSGALIVAEMNGGRIRRVELNGRVSTLAGGGDLPSGAGDRIKLELPVDVATTPAGIVYATDQATHRIYRFQQTGADPARPSDWEGVVVSSAVPNPWGITVAPDGVLYVTSLSYHELWRVLPSGEATAIVGDGQPGDADGLGNVARFGAPSDVAWSDGALFVAEYGNHRLRRVRLSPNGNPREPGDWQVATVAGGGSGNQNGAGTDARFDRPVMLASAGSGRLLVSDFVNHAVREVTVAPGSFDEGSGTSTTSEPVQLSNASGRLPGPNGTVRPFIDYQWFDLSTPGRSVLGPGETSPTQDWWFVVPEGVRRFSFTVTVEAATGGLVPVDAVTNSGGAGAGSPNVMVSTIAGSTEGLAGNNDGFGTAARFLTPEIDADAQGNVYVAEWYNKLIRRVGTDGLVTTIAGRRDGAGGGIAGNADGPGTTATFYDPRGTAVSDDGTVIYVADFWQASNTIRRIALTPGTDPTDAANWTVSTIAGTPGPRGKDNGAGNVARFAGPMAIAIARVDRTLYVREEVGARIRRLQLSGGDPTIAANWAVSLLAGDDSKIAGDTGYADGVGSAARIAQFGDIDVDPAGNLIVCEGPTKRIRKITPDGVVSTFAGPTDATTTGAYVDGPSSVARFMGPAGIAVDAAGYIYVADFDGHRIRVISPTGRVATVAGTGTAGYADGPGNTAVLRNPASLACDAKGDVYWMEGPAGLLRRLQRVVGAGGE